MRHTGAAVRVRDGEVDVIVCHPDVFHILMEHIHDREFADGWYAFTIIQSADRVTTGLVPIDDLPEL